MIYPPNEYGYDAPRQPFEPLATVKLAIFVTDILWKNCLKSNLEQLSRDALINLMRFLMMAAYDLSPVYILMYIFHLSHIKKKSTEWFFRILTIPLYSLTPALTEFDSQYEKNIQDTFFCFMRTITANRIMNITDKVLNHINSI